MNVKKVGIVVAIEINAVLTKYGEPYKTEERHGYRVITYKNGLFEMYVVDSGAGEISAASATQFLISEYQVDMVMNFGVVGALTEEMKSAELCVVERVIHYDFESEGWLNLEVGQYPDRDSQYFNSTQSLIEAALKINPNLKRVTCASADKFINDAEDKIALHNRFGADICEMEAAGVLITCNRNGVPCLLIKTVADSLTGGGEEFFAALERTSIKCFDVLDEIIRGIM